MLTSLGGRFGTNICMCWSRCDGETCFVGMWQEAGPVLLCVWLFGLLVYWQHTYITVRVIKPILVCSEGQFAQHSCQSRQRLTGSCMPVMHLLLYWAGRDFLEAFVGNLVVHGTKLVLFMTDMHYTSVHCGRAHVNARCANPGPDAFAAHSHDVLNQSRACS
jgi:hypothetical protein